MTAFILYFLVSAVENFVLLNTFLTLLCTTAALIATRTSLTRHWQPKSRATFCAAALAGPPLLSLWLVTAAILPAAWLQGTGRGHEHGHQSSVHLINVYTSDFEPILGLLTLLVALCAFALIARACWRAYGRINALASQCLDHATLLADYPPGIEKLLNSFCSRRSLQVQVVSAPVACSFVLGYRRARLVLTNTLLQTLTPEELLGVLEHEAVHYRRGDNTRKLILTICRYSSLAFPLASVVYQRWSEQVELICDGIAASRTHKPLDIAQALVRVRRVAMNIPELAYSGFFTGRDQIEERILHLLALAERQTTSLSVDRSSWRIACTIAVFFAASLLLLFVSAPLVVHHAIEAALY